MTMFKTVGILGALWIAVVGNTVLGQVTNSQKTAGSSGNHSVVNDAQPAKNGQDKSAKPNPRGDSENSDKPGRTDYPDQVKKMLDAAKAAQVKFLNDQKDLQRKLKDATEAEKDQIRNEMRDKRDAFLEQQKEMREEFRKRVTELKDQLPNHGDVINAAKDQGKDKVPRKGGGG
jgi:hypothetical protein